MRNLIHSLLFFTAIASTQSAVAFESQLSVYWNNHFISEGRDNLDGNSLVATNLEVTNEKPYGSITAGLWYAESPDQNFDELQASIGFTKEFGTTELSASYVFVDSPFEDASDREIGLGAAWAELFFDVNLALEGAYSTGANGWFFELSADREFSFTEKLSLTSSSVFGVNQGFVNNGHDGANHIAFQLDANYDLQRGLNISAYVARSFALNNDEKLEGDVLLRDTSVVGMSINLIF